MAIFKGAAVAIVTPMHEDGKVNYEKLEELLEYQIANSTDAIVICGTTGESSTLTHGEHLQTIKFAIDKVAGRVPVIAGTGSNCTETAVMMSQEAASYGADALLIVTPYYNKASQKGLIRHYTEIANSVPETPIIMYNVPSRTGCNIQPATAVALAKNVKNIVAIKEASGNIAQVAKLMSLAGDEIELYSGNDDQITSALALGAKGVISVLANLVPGEVHSLCQAFFDGNAALSDSMQLKYLELIERLFSDVNPIPVKQALCYMGIPVGRCRLPLCEMDDIAAERLLATLQKYELCNSDETHRAGSVTVHHLPVGLLWNMIAL